MSDAGHDAVREHDLAVLDFCRRTGGYTYVNDEGNYKSGAQRPQDLPEDALEIVGPRPSVKRGGQYARRLRRRTQAAKHDRYGE